MASTTPKARALGAELRKARERANISIRKLAAIMEVSHSELSRAETGERPPKLERVVAILNEVGVNGAEFEKIVAMSRDTGGSHWLGVGMPEQQVHLGALVDFEQTAERITDVSPLLIPGLLQTSGYTRAVMITAGVPKTEVGTRVTMRVGRREALRGADPASLDAFIGQAALRHTIGSADVMPAQLKHLLVSAAEPNITVRIIPDQTGWHPGLEGPFTLLDFSAASPIVHLESRRSGLFLHEDDDVQAYRTAVERIREIAMSPEESSGLIAEVIKKMEM